ncbi:MAG TPA: exodeoxyribonuclease VII small subunit [Anaeromyxobacteraceae bacterium]|nr:exodeoxyribonuclease VII small subunit [Anaeromyxobacteraceae bacterium]
MTTARQGEKGERGGKAGAAAPEPYDELVARLEQVVGALEAGGLTLEQSIEKFAEGMRLVRDAGQRLDEAERRVEQLVRSASGEDEEVPFEDGDGKGGGDGGR